MVARLRCWKEGGLVVLLRDLELREEEERVRREVRPTRREVALKCMMGVVVKTYRARAGQHGRGSHGEG